jgi:uncharacterized membrane-anchored protein
MLPAAPAPVRARPRAVLAVISAGTVVTVWLWWHGTPPFGGFGDWLTNAGRITGLLAGYGVAVLIALMARIPPALLHLPRGRARVQPPVRRRR